MIRTQQRYLRIRLLLLAALLVLATTLPAYAQIYWEPTSGPQGGTASGFVTNRAGQIFVASDNGVYRSFREPIHWTRTSNGLPVTSILSIGIDSADNLYAGTTDVGLYRSIDNGENWVRVLPESPNTYVLRILTHHTTGEIIHTTGLTAYTSSDNGESWTPTGLGEGPTAIAYDSAGRALAAMNGAFLRSEAPPRTTWDTLTPIPGGNPGPTALIVTPLGSYIAGTRRDGMYRSTNGGANWTRVGAGTVDTAIRALAVAPDGSIVVSTDAGRIFRSIDDGVGWGWNAEGFQLIYSFLFGPSSGRMLIGTSDGPYSSSDGGVSWLRSDSGLISTFISTMSRRSDGKIFAGTLNGRLYSTTDRGTTWERSQLQLPRTRSVTGIVHPTTGETVLSAAGSGVHLSQDNGITWEERNNGIPTLAITAMTLTNSGAILTGGDSGLIGRSTDLGITWSSTVVDSTVSVISFAIDSSGGVLAGTSNGLYHSADDGMSWRWIGNGITMPFIGSIAVSSNGAYYVGAYNGNFFSSTNGGTSWTRSIINQNAVLIIALAVDSNGTIVAGSSNRGAYRSTDSGKTWQRYNQGLTSNSAYALVLEPDNRLFVGTAGAGVFRSIDPVSSVPHVDADYPAAMYSDANVLPNPTNGITRISFTAPQTGNLRVTVSDLYGRRVSVFTLDNTGGRRMSFTWDATALPSGLYMVRIGSGGSSITLPIIRQ